MLFFLGTIWALPNSLIGLGYALIGWTRFDGTRDGCLHFIAKPGGICAWVFGFRFYAITFGNVQIWASHRESLVVSNQLHENRHTLQSHLLGPLFVIAYGLCSLWALVRGKDGYRDNALELDAREHE